MFYGNLATQMIASNTRQWNVTQIIPINVTEFWNRFSLGNSVKWKASPIQVKEAAVIHNDVTETIHQISFLVSRYCNVAGIHTEAENKKAAARMMKVYFPKNEDSFAPSEIVIV